LLSYGCSVLMLRLLRYLAIDFSSEMGRWTELSEADMTSRGVITVHLIKVDDYRQTDYRVEKD
jgi:hypothetical protein